MPPVKVVFGAQADKRPRLVLLVGQLRHLQALDFKEAVASKLAPDVTEAVRNIWIILFVPESHTQERRHNLVHCGAGLTNLYLIWPVRRVSHYLYTVNVKFHCSKPTMCLQFF